VVVDSPKSGTATGENGVYSVAPRTVLLTGNVVLKKGKDVMRGAQLTVNLATGQAVLPMGGFSGSVPEPTLARVKQLVAAGQLRFFMLGGGGGFAGPGGVGTGDGSETAQIEAWVESSCHTVQVPGADSTGTLYQCGTR